MSMKIKRIEIKDIIGRGDLWAKHGEIIEAAREVRVGIRDDPIAVVWIKITGIGLDIFVDVEYEDD